MRHVRLLVLALAMVALVAQPAAAAEFSESAEVPGIITVSGATLTLQAGPVKQEANIPPTTAGGTLTLTVSAQVEQPTFAHDVQGTCVIIKVTGLKAGAQLNASFKPADGGETVKTPPVTVNRQPSAEATVCA
ncbi:MAG: hypothetical protein M3O70_19370 [Actinomycetota bacterium]|nr:hypothetical protein [Actinomycetota bacterium]